jgi:hypothetical protein
MSNEFQWKFSQAWLPERSAHELCYAMALIGAIAALSQLLLDVRIVDPFAVAPAAGEFSVQAVVMTGVSGPV